MPQTLDLELQEIMKGSFSHFMLKEIYEQPESVVNTMRGRVLYDERKVILGGLGEHMSDIRRCRRLLFVACGTSYNSCVATRQFIEEVRAAPPPVELAGGSLHHVFSFVSNGPPQFPSQVNSDHAVTRLRSPSLHITCEAVLTHVVPPSGTPLTR